MERTATYITKVEDILPRLLTETVDTAAARVRLRRHRRAVFACTYLTILVGIAALVAVAIVQIVAVMQTGDDSPRQAAATNAWAAFVLFVFVIPAVAAIDLHTEKKGR